MRRPILCLFSGLAFIQPLPAMAQAEAPSVARSLSRSPYDQFVTDAAQRFGLPTVWIRAVMRAESNGDAHAVSPKGAIGLMQVMPDTWAGLRLRHRLGSDPYDPHDNILAGSAYIRELFDRYGSPGWIAAYNAGPTRYEASLNGRPLPAETRAYVAAIAPVIDGHAPATPIMVAATEPPDWTHAPLFIARPEHRPTADRPVIEPASDDAASTVDVRHASAIVQPSSGLFVSRRANGEVR